MLTHLPASAWLAAAIALVPAVLRLLWGRPLVRLLDDPVLPERLLANQRRNTQALAGSVALLVVGFPSSATWTIPLLIVARGVAAFPLRKALYAETWSLFAYLSFFGRLIAAMFGFWVLLASVPMLALAAHDRAWIVALGLAALLLVWNARSAQVLRALLRVRAITDAALLSRFHSMVAAAGIPATRFDYVDMKGGVLANAVAVPSLSSPGVIFTDTLLARLDAHEIAAICGHELAHLEHYNPARLRRLNRLGIALITAAAALGPVARISASDASAVTVVTIWPFVLLMVLVWRARDRQRNETASDLRAVALCGDADALARALTKLHAFARVPRRWNVELERQATHPSLARRLRDIHAAAGAPARSLDEPVRFPAADGTVVVTLDRAHVTWQEGDAATHQFNYTHLTELRVDARPTGAPRLVAVEAAGRRWEMSLAPADVQRAQAVLDFVDGRLSPSVPAPRVTPAVGRTVSAITAFAAAAAGQFAFAVVAVLAAMRPGPQLLGAVGLAGLMAAALSARDASWLFSIAMALPLALCGLTLCWIAWSQRTDSRGAPTRLVGGLGILGALSCVLLVSTGFNVVRIHQAAKTIYAAPVMLFAFAGAMALARTRVARRAALAAAALGAAVATIGSPMFLDRLGRDPFLVRAEPLVFTPVTGAPQSEFNAAFQVGDLRVSPHGHAIAIARSEDDEQAEDVSTFHVGPAAGPLTPIKADEVRFLDDARLVAMTIGPGGTDVREIRLAAPGVDGWCVHVDVVRSGTLSVDVEGRSWQLLGWDRSRRIVRAQGRIGHPGVDVTHWNGFGSKSAWVAATTTSGTTLIAVETQYDRGLFSAAASMMWALPFLATRSESHIWRVTPDGASQVGLSRLDSECADGPIDDAIVCTAFDGVSTRVLRIDASTGSVTPVGTVDGRFVAYGGLSPGWVTGWSSSGPAALRINSRTGVRVDGWPRATSIAGGIDAIGTVSYAPRGSIVRIYRF